MKSTSENIRAVLSDVVRIALASDKEWVELMGADAGEVAEFMADRTAELDAWIDKAVAEALRAASDLRAVSLATH